MSAKQRQFMQQIQQHPSTVDAYIKEGYKLVPIPPGTKGPQHKGWNLQGRELKSAADLPQDWGVGVAHAYSGTMALDIDSWGQAYKLLKEIGVDLDKLYDAPDAVIIDSGREGRGKLIYRMPFGMAVPTKKINYKDEFNSYQVAYELRSATTNHKTVQDVLPPSVHPLTGESYKWAGKGHWSRIPEIPPQLLAHWNDLINDDSQRKISAGAEVNASWDEIRSALAHISPDVCRDDWLHVGMALHYAGVHAGEEDQALQLFDDWSAEGEKYQGEKDIISVWGSLKPNNGITLGTLFHIAGQYGWSRPVPDASELFGAVNTTTDAPDQPAVPSPDDIIDAMRPPSPELDLNLVPTVIAQRSNEVAESIGCDPLVPLFAGLSVVCAAADSRIRLKLVDGFEVPPVLWMMTVGDPADKKSPGSRPMFKILKTLEKEDKPRYQQDYLQFEAQEAAYGSAHKAFLEYAADPQAQMENDSAPTLPGEPIPPTPLKFTVSDITSQKLVHLCSVRPEGMLCYLDEMNSWVAKVTNKNSGDLRSTWVQGIESEPYEMDRVGGGSIHCENFAVSIYGNIQPDIFRNNIEALADDGLIQRFIPVVLRPHFTKLGNPIPDMMTNTPQWDQMIRTIHALPEQTYQLAPDAYKVFREFQQWYEAVKQDERIVNSHKWYRTAFGKLEGLTGRLTLVFHMMQDPYNLQVPVDTVKQVIEMVKSYIVPAYRYTLGEMGGVVDDSLDTWMTNHITYLSGEQSTVTMNELRRSARQKVKKVQTWQANQMVRDSMYLLEKAGWVAVLEDQPTKNHVVWSINPQLATLFKDRREKVIKAKQRIYDSFHTAAVDQRKRNPNSRPLVPGYDPGTMDD